MAATSGSAAASCTTCSANPATTRSRHRPPPPEGGAVAANRVFRLRRRPEGLLRDGDLELVTEPVPELTAGQALVRTLVLSVDPTSRIWMGHLRAFMPPVPID